MKNIVRFLKFYLRKCLRKYVLFFMLKDDLENWINSLEGGIESYRVLVLDWN